MKAPKGNIDAIFFSIYLLVCVLIFVYTQLLKTTSIPISGWIGRIFEVFGK